MPNKKTLIAMIPARIGSQRVPKKNIRLLCGKPLIQYAINTALESGCFDEVWVNSESDLLCKVAFQCGVSFHKRPPELATDTATNQDFTYEFLRVHACDYLIMVNPTSPLLKPETIRRFCDYTRSGKFDTVLSVLDEKAECFFNGGPVNFSIDEKINSQKLMPVQKVIWALTAWRRKTFLEIADRGGCSVFAGKLARFPIPIGEACDIDTQEEWDLAEAVLLFRSKKIQKSAGLHSTPRYWEPHDDNREK
jgi:CMP-N-acetylneuraminic acid synthetase